RHHQQYSVDLCAFGNGWLRNLCQRQVRSYRTNRSLTVEICSRLNPCQCAGTTTAIHTIAHVSIQCLRGSLRYDAPRRMLSQQQSLSLPVTIRQLGFGWLLSPMAAAKSANLIPFKINKAPSRNNLLDALAVQKGT